MISKLFQNLESLWIRIVAHILSWTNVASESWTPNHHTKRLWCQFPVCTDSAVMPWKLFLNIETVHLYDLLQSRAVFSVTGICQIVGDATFWKYGSVCEFVYNYIPGEKNVLHCQKRREWRMKRATQWREILQHKTGATSIFRIWVVGSSKNNVYCSFSSGLHSSGFMWFNQSS